MNAPYGISYLSRAAVGASTAVLQRAVDRDDQVGDLYGAIAVGIGRRAGGEIRALQRDVHRDDQFGDCDAAIAVAVPCARGRRTGRCEDRRCGLCGTAEVRDGPRRC